MPNPFRHDGPLPPGDLIGREPDLRRLVRAADQGDPLLARGAAGVGLTSLAWGAAERLETEGMPSLYASVWGSGSLAEVTMVLTSSLEEGASRPGRPGEDLLPGATAGAGLTASAPPAHHVDARGPGLGAPGGEEDALRAVDRALELARGEAERHGCRIALLVDDLPPGVAGDAVGWRALTDGAARGPLSLLLFSSRPGPATGEGEDRAPWEGGPASLPVRSLPFEAWLPFVLERFLETDRWIANEHVRWLVDAAGGHPRRTQALFHSLWDLLPAGGRTGEDLLLRALRSAVDRRTPGHQLLWSGLTHNQRRTLLGLALSGEEPEPFSRRFLDRAGLSSPSSVQRSLEALEERGLVEETQAGHRLADPFLRRWLLHRLDRRGGPPGAEASG